MYTENTGIGYIASTYFIGPYKRVFDPGTNGANEPVIHVDRPPYGKVVSQILPIFALSGAIGTCPSNRLMGGTMWHKHGPRSGVQVKMKKPKSTED